MQRPICLLVSALLLGNFESIDARAQSQTIPPGFPDFQGQAGFPSIPGFPQGGFQQGGISQGGFLGGSQNTQQVEELKRQCLANGGPNAFREVEQAGNNMQQCVSSLLPNIQTISDKSPGGICKFMQGTLRKCLTELSAKLERCMNKVTAYAPAFTIDAFDSVFKFLCKDDAKHILTLMTSMAHGNPCFQALQVSAKSCLSETKKLQIDTLQGVGANISKAELCSDTKILRDCVNRKSRESCTGENLEFVTGITNALYEPCSACKLFITNTFILLALFILTKLF